MVRSMMAHASLRISFRGDALLVATYIHNRVPSKSIIATPYELWFGKKPSLDHLCPQGLTGCVHNPIHRHRKVSPRAIKMMFIRYPTQSKGYVICKEHPNGGLTEIDSHNIDFLDDEFLTIAEINKDVKLFELPQDIQPSFSEGENLNSNEVSEDGMPPLSERNGGDLSA